MEREESLQTGVLNALFSEPDLTPIYEPMLVNKRRLSIFPSWTSAGWKDLGRFDAQNSKPAKQLDGSVLLQHRTHGQQNIGTYIVTMQQSWNLFEYEPVLHVTGWLTMVCIEW